MTEICKVISEGLIDYDDASELQKRLHGRVADGTLPNQLLLLEHPHIYTLGRRAKTSDILATDEFLSKERVRVHRTDRGGEVTYHGPGQLVAYPIVNIKRWGGGPLKYVRALEQTVIATLGELGIVANSQDCPTGVWVDDAKIAAIGVRISRGTTTHGVSLNVDPNLSMFDHIVPCGMADLKVTAISALAQDEMHIDQVIPVFVRNFGRTFGFKME
jgi:lipoate-protein ligase B